MASISNLKSEISNPHLFLGLDLGTTNVKAMVTDRVGRLLARGSCPVRLFHVEGGGVEQDLDEIERATLTALREAVASVDGSAIEAIGVSSQGGAMQTFDADGRRLGRVISWLDQRGRPFDDALTAELGKEWFRQRIGHGRSGMALGQLLRLRQEQPDRIHGGVRVGFVGDLIVERLCGRGAQDGTSCGLTLLYNPARSDYDTDVLERLELGRRQLPDLLSPREAAGGLRTEVAHATGLRAGLPVSVAVHDQYTSALSTGAVRPGSVMVGTGTAWVLLAVSDELPAPVIDDAFVCRHVVEGRFGQIVSLVNGGCALSWALELMRLGGKSAGDLEAMLSAAPAGSAGLRFWPFLVPSGASGLPADTHGRLVGLQLSHGPGHVVRAVVEGLAFELNRHLDFLRAAGMPLERLVMSGGAASGRVTPQILADVTGLPLHCGESANASLLGAAIVARGLRETTRSLEDLADEMAPASRVVAPGGGALSYREQYQDYLQSLPVPGSTPP